MSIFSFFKRFNRSRFELTDETTPVSPKLPRISRLSLPIQAKKGPLLKASGALPHGTAVNGQANGARPKPQASADNALTVLGTDIQSGKAVATGSLKERFQSLYGIGGTGTGKTTLLLNMVLSDI